MTHLIFTDLDGTLLDEKYSWAAASPALDLLAREGLPWVMVSSKTRAEMEEIRADLGHVHPFIVENGGAAFIPRGYFGATAPDAVIRDGYEVLEWGTPYARLVRCLREAAAMTHCAVRGFAEMSVAEVSAETGLSETQAARAKQREYDEPFIAGDEDRLPALRDAIARAGYGWTWGGRFHHIFGKNDKANAVEALIWLYERQFGPVTTIGLGDSLNDAGFLRMMRQPVVIASRQRATPAELEIPGALRTARPGPDGWNEAVLELLGARAGT
jgi:mannosyl-3-phosphoglycerate phosphatase